MGRTISHPSRTALKPTKKSARPFSPILMGRVKAFSNRKTEAGVLISDQDGRILYLNEAAQRVLDTSGEKDLSCGSLKNARLREILFDLLLEYKQRSDLRGKGLTFIPQTVVSRNLLYRESSYRIRSIPLEPHGTDRHKSYLLLLIEKIFVLIP